MKPYEFDCIPCFLEFFTHSAFVKLLESLIYPFEIFYFHKIINSNMLYFSNDFATTSMRLLPSHHQNHFL